MWTERRNDKVIQDALREQNRGNWTGAERLFQRAGNQYRDPQEKQLLWESAKRAREIAQQD